MVEKKKIADHLSMWWTGRIGIRFGGRKEDVLVKPREQKEVVFMLTMLKDATLTTVIRRTNGVTISARRLGAVSILVKEAPVGTAESFDDSHSYVVAVVVMV